ncbi:hypothetical protein BDY24DRAFT_272768 [Mrakia frigida]|uniref:WW domain-containing protein n=1 Tax=Mrakia frigida TaxID=29902 RepID=UPI003FCC2162
MSLDTRPLPEGWVATFDNNYKATFYVNTTKTPPESTWVHPSDVPAFAPSPGPPPSKPTETETSAHNPDVKVGEREFQQAALASPSSSSAPAFSQTSYNQAVEPPKKKGGFGGFLAKLTDKIPQQQQHQQQEKQHSFGQSPYSQPPTGGPPPQFMGHQQQGYQNYPVQGGGPGGYGGPGQYGGGYPQQQQVRRIAIRFLERERKVSFLVVIENLTSFSSVCFTARI